MSWTTYTPCSLCSARTPSFQTDDHRKGETDAHNAARALGFVELPASISLERRRLEGHWLCGDCARDVNHATAFKAADELRAMQERGGMPCAHTIGDLIGGTDAVTKCGACLAERQKAREEAAKPEPCSRCKVRGAEFGDLCGECEIYDHGDPKEIAELEATRASEGRAS